MLFQRTETSLILARGSDGRIYDLHQIAHQSRPMAAEETAPWSVDRVEWLMSNGAVVETADKTTFRVVGTGLEMRRFKDFEAPEILSESAVRSPPAPDFQPSSPSRSIADRG